MTKSKSISARVGCGPHNCLCPICNYLCIVTVFKVHCEDYHQTNEDGIVIDSHGHVWICEAIKVDRGFQHRYQKGCQHLENFKLVNEVGTFTFAN